MKLVIGCDPNAADLKNILMQQAIDLGHSCDDAGSEDPIYANVAIQVAEDVAAGKYDRGIIVCGTGIGVCIAANKVPGAYAALCSDVFSTERSVLSNNCNIMTMGAQVTGVELAKTMLKAWLNVTYEPGGRSEPKVQRIIDYADSQTK